MSFRADIILGHGTIAIGPFTYNGKISGLSFSELSHAQVIGSNVYGESRNPHRVLVFTKTLEEVESIQNAVDRLREKLKKELTKAVEDER